MLEHTGVTMGRCLPDYNKLRMFIVFYRHGDYGRFLVSTLLGVNRSPYDSHPGHLRSSCLSQEDEFSSGTTSLVRYLQQLKGDKSQRRAAAVPDFWDLGELADRVNTVPTYLAPSLHMDTCFPTNTWTCFVASVVTCPAFALCSSSKTHWETPSSSQHSI
ncbi:hypothetical protein OBBRIDRAFT_607279 [Obba rivulosa]|uniref:Uncharacterized protein n=1 Tax=Obba rivulosa TaxID=1052685 RepID=A0A8E2AY94_9APHY|nr:hypothetical protein OBBRIDRAFT_607279 [Obba rivulosa]